MASGDVLTPARRIKKSGVFHWPPSDSGQRRIFRWSLSALVCGGKPGTGRCVTGNIVEMTKLIIGFQSHSVPLHQAVWSGSLKAVKVLVEAGADLPIREKIWSDIRSGGQSMVNILPSQTTFKGKIADKDYWFAAVSPMRIVTRDDFFSWTNIFFMFVSPRKPGDHTLNSPRKLPRTLTFSLWKGRMKEVFT